MHQSDGSLGSGPRRGADDLVFERKGSPVWPVLLAFGGAAFLVFLTLILFFLNVLLETDSPTRIPFYAFTVLLIMGCIGYGVSQLRKPVRIALTPKSLRIEWLIQAKRFEWTEIAQLRRGKAEASTQMLFLSPVRKKEQLYQLTLLDENGKKLFQVASDYPGFEDLAREIQVRATGARGEPVYDREKHVAEALKKQRSSRRLLLVLGSFLLVMGIGGFYSSYQGYSGEKRMKERGVVTEATVERLWKRNVARWVEYGYRSGDGTEHLDQARMRTEAWEELSVGDTLPVRYDPLEPAKSELVSGQVKNREFSDGWIMAATALVTLVGLVCVIAYPLGIADIKAEGGKIRLIRVGEVDPEEVPPVEPDEPVFDNGEFPVGAGDMPEWEDSVAEGGEVWGETIGTAAEEPSEVQPVVSGPPGGVKALGVLNIVIGLAGCLFHGVAAGFVFLLYVGGMGMEQDGGEAFVEISLTDYLISTGWHLAAILFLMLLFVSGIGLLRYKRWGLRMALSAAGGLIVVAIWKLVGVIVYIDTAGLDEEAAFILRLGKVIAICLVLLLFIYPAVLFFVLGRKSIRDAFP